MTDQCFKPKEDNIEIKLYRLLLTTEDRLIASHLTLMQNVKPHKVNVWGTLTLWQFSIYVLLTDIEQPYPCYSSDFVVNVIPCLNEKV